MAIKSKKLKDDIRKSRASNARLLKAFEELEKHGPNGVGAVADSKRTVITHWDGTSTKRRKS